MIDWEVDGAVGIATVNRPERRNALDVEHCELLRERLESATGLRAVVVTGSGSAFCAGADLGSRFESRRGDDHAAVAPEDLQDDPFHDVLQALLDAVGGHPLPVLAAVNGPALGAGTQLATACDLRVASRDAVFGIPAVRLGIMISAASAERVARLVGHADASEMLLTGRRYSADEALKVRLVHRVVDDALDEALHWAGEIADYAPLAVQGHKRELALIASSGGLDDPARAEIASLIARAVNSDDLREGVAAFTEKRTPRFLGR